MGEPSPLVAYQLNELPGLDSNQQRLASKRVVAYQLNELPGLDSNQQRLASKASVLPIELPGTVGTAG